MFKGLYLRGTNYGTLALDRLLLEGRNELALSTRVFDRARLPTGVPIPGPAIVEQADTTTVIGPGQTARLDECQNLVITLEAAEAA